MLEKSIVSIILGSIFLSLISPSSSSAANSITVEVLRWRQIMEVEPNTKVPTLNDLKKNSVSLCKNSSVGQDGDGMAVGSELKAYAGNGETVGVGRISKTYSQSSTFYWLENNSGGGFRVFTYCVFEGKIPNLLKASIIQVCFGQICSKELDKKSLTAQKWVVAFPDISRLGRNYVNFAKQSLASQIALNRSRQTIQPSPTRATAAEIAKMNSEIKNDAENRFSAAATKTEECILDGTCQLIIDTRVPRTILGVTFDAAYAGPGAKILSCTPGGPAEKSGIPVGLVINSIDGISVPNTNIAIMRIQSYLPGNQISLVGTSSSGTMKTFRITLVSSVSN